MTLNIVTPEGIVYDDQVEMVTVRTIDGDRGIMPEHEPMVTGVDIGAIRIQDGNNEYHLAASHGYMEVKPDEVTILVEAAESSDEIDVERAKEAKKRAEDRLDKNEEHIDEKRAEIALQKALNRIKVSKGRNFE